LTTNKKFYVDFSKKPFLHPYSSRWRTPAILKIVKLPYLDEKSSDFDEIWSKTSDLQLDDSHVAKCEKF